LWRSDAKHTVVLLCRGILGTLQEIKTNLSERELHDCENANGGAFLAMNSYPAAK
jgi:hypothetical protein